MFVVTAEAESDKSKASGFVIVNVPWDSDVEFLWSNESEEGTQQYWA